MVRSRNGSFNLLPGVKLDLVGVSDAPVTVTIARDLAAIANDVTELVDSFNAVSARIDEHTSFDAESFETGPLHGQGIVLNLEHNLRRRLMDIVEGIGSATNNITAIGIDIDSRGRLTLDSEALLAALNDRFEQVVDLFTHSARLSGGTRLSDVNNGVGIATDTGNEIRLNFQDGTALDLDLDGLLEISDLLNLFNADARVTAAIGSSGRNLVLTDNTTGGSTFQIVDLNSSGGVASLGILSSIDSDGDGEIFGSALLVADELGVGRRLDFELERYVSPFDGIFTGLTDSADAQVARLNEDIERLQAQIELERVRLRRQFAAMENFLAQSQSLQSILLGQLQVLDPPSR